MKPVDVAAQELLDLVDGVLVRRSVQRLESTAWATSTVARLSGDEFIVVDGFAGPQEATGLAARILEVLRAPTQIPSLEVVTSTSIGVAAAEDDDETTGR